MKIRKTKLKDKNQVRKILTDLLLHDLPFDENIDPEWTKTKRWDEDFESIFKDNDSLSLVVEESGEIVGYLSGVLQFTQIYYKQTLKMASIETIIVNKNFRRKGIGEKLVEKFERWARDNGCDKTTVTPNYYNVLGNNFYKKVGFKELDIKYQKNI